MSAGLLFAGHRQPEPITKSGNELGAQHFAVQADNENATLQGRWAKGPTFAVSATEDGHVYFGDGSEFVCATIRSGGVISELGRVVLPGAPKDIELSANGPYAYVAMGYQGVAVVDISASSDPQLIHVLDRQDNPFEAKAVAKSGSRLYIAAGSGGLMEAYIYQPDSIVFGDTYVYANCNITDVTARNDTLFAASSSKALEMLRYANGQFYFLNRVNYNKYTNDYQNQTPMASSVFWQHDSLFVADSWTGVFFFTVEDTALNYSGVGLGGCQNVIAQGKYVYTTDYYNVNVLSDNGGTPSFRDSKEVSTSMQLTYAKNYVIVASKCHGIYTFENSDKATLHDGGFYATSSLTYDVFQQKYYLYRITPINTLDVIAVQNPAGPHTAGHLDLGGDNEEAHKIYVQGDTAFVYSYDYMSGESRIYFIDVSDPSGPKKLASWTYPSTDNSFYDIAARGKHLYAVMNQDVLIIDFSDLANVHETGKVTTSGWIEDLAVQGNYVYTASEDQGMSVVDVSDPAHPAKKATFRQSDSDYYVQIRVQDHYAYAANSYNGLTIIDISNPEAPALAGTFTQADGDFNASQLAVSGNYAYIDRGWGEVIFLNISNPVSPQLKGAYNVNNLTGLTTYSRIVYAADSYTGIYAVSNDNPDAGLPCHFAGEVSGEWSCPKIYLEGDVTIPAGDTLCITESVQKVFALGPYQIRVEGVLIAKGPKNERVDLSGNRILFSGNDWRGIYFNNLNESGAGTSLIENCRFDYGDKRDMSYQGGGAIAIYNSDKVIVRHSVFYKNVARLGGAIYIENASPKIEDCYFEINGRGGVNTEEMYTEGGGAMYIKNANPYLHRLRFTKNGAHSGGAMVIDGCSPTLSNVLFDQNISGGLAGAVAITSDISNPAAARFVNVTMADNEAPSGGGALQLMGPATHPEIINSILFGNDKPEIYINSGTPTVTYSIVDSAVTESWFGTGCLSDDPRFDESGEINYHLMATSCGAGINSVSIDAGHPDSMDTYLDCSAGLGTARADMGYYGGRYADLSTGIGGENAEIIPQKLTLKQNYPNPFNPTTIIRYRVTLAGQVNLIVFKLLGQKVATLVDLKQSPGEYSISFDASRLSSGVYFYRLTAGHFVQTRKMLLVR